MKRKININRQEVSADEISQRKDFNSVLKNSSTLVQKPLFKKPWFLSGVVALTAVVVTTILLLGDKKEVVKSTAPVVQGQEDSGLSEFYKTEEAKPCIAPPLKGLNVPYVVYKVNAEKGGSFEFGTGSRLTVPENAFAGADGKPLKGEIELRYREFHDVADFFVSGIPMTYDSAGRRYHFESAGMMEMLAYKDGKQVEMAAGKTINVELASEQQGTHYNLYKLDTVKNNWSCLGKEKVVVSADKPGTSLNVAPEQEFEQLQEYRQIEKEKAEAKTEMTTQLAALPDSPPEPVKPAKLNKEKYTFNLELDLKEFPEFSVYKNVQWELSPENKGINKAVWADLNKTLWEDATLNKSEESYVLHLLKGSRKVELVVYPVFEGKNYEAAMKGFQEKFDKYSASLEKRKQEEKKIEEEYQAKILAAKKKQEEALAKWKRDRDRELAAMGAEQKVKRVFMISSFGIYNCDHPSVYPQGVICSNAVFVKQDEQKIKCYEIFLADKKRNGIYTYVKNPVQRFTFDPKSSNVLWTVEDGVLHYLRAEDFAGIKNGDKEILMKRVDQEFKTMEDMKAFFNI
ncbi:MAG TPA: hypothetical protein VF868_00335 [Bacteroidia bacterium]|jgi:hypothetical protein